ncbi:MAG: hypothetical protein ACTHLV_00175, partial [Achromobacter mucicolens]
MTALTMSSALSAKAVRMPLWEGARQFRNSVPTFVEPRSTATVSEWVLQSLAGPAMERIIEVGSAVTHNGASMLSR